MLAAVLVLLFLAGSFASAYQAMRWIERRQRRLQAQDRRDRRPPR
jgi:hypothetical protein